MPERVREALDRDGYAVVRDLLPPDEVAVLAAAFERLVATARTLPGTAEVGSAKFVLDPDPFRLHRVVWCGGAEPDLERLGGDPRFLRLAVAALGADPVVQLVQQAHFKLPGDEVDFAWHQDASNRRYGTDLFTDVDGRGSFVQIALAVDPSGARNGGLQVIPGSHRLGFVADPETGRLPEGLFDPSAARSPELDPGDALVFGPFLLHGSQPNRSDGPRRLFLQGYAAPGANARVYPGCGTGRFRSLREARRDSPSG
jgi:ectoine hydroxylase-related dioxygenase (phytanoyl-CoA dioxygenase family)